jgi:serine/threonine protein kinase
MKMAELEARLRAHGYVVGRELGRGASGKVFIAGSERSAAEVAIKVIRGEVGGQDPEHRRILVANETTLSWKLFHPYLITVSIPLPTASTTMW